MLLWLKLADPSDFVYVAISYLISLICLLPYTVHSALYLYTVIKNSSYMPCFLLFTTLTTPGVTIHILY